MIQALPPASGSTRARHGVKRENGVPRWMPIRPPGPWVPSGILSCSPYWLLGLPASRAGRPLEMLVEKKKISLGFRLDGDDEVFLAVGKRGSERGETI